MDRRLTPEAQQRIREVLAEPGSWTEGEPDPDLFERLLHAYEIVAPLPLVVYDIELHPRTGEPRYTFLWGNPTLVAGSSARAMLDDRPVDFVDPRDEPDVIRAIAEAGRDGRFETAYRVNHRERGAVWTFAIGTSRDGRGHRGLVVQSDQFGQLRSELASKTRMLEAFAASLPGSIFQLHMTPDGAISCPFCSTSVREILGVTAERVMADPDLLGTFVVEEDRDLVLQAAIRSARDLSPGEMSFRVRKPDGTIKTVWSGGVPQREADGSTLWTSLSVDISEVARRSHEAEARTRAFFESEKLESLGRLAGGMAHDINNLLVGVLGNAELLREGVLPAWALEIADEIALAAEGCADLTGQILAFSGRGKVHEEVLDLRPLVEHTVRLARAGASPEIRVALGPEPLVVRGDATQLRQVVLNLVTNALHASPAEPVDVRGRIEEGWVCVEIEDRGPGIAPEHRTRVFEPYFTTKRDGRGLGLASAHGIVREHGGRLTFASTPGAGTTFEVRLPRDPERPRPAAALPPTVDDLGGLRVLVVDDQPEVLTMTLRMLRSRGAEADGLTDPRLVRPRLGDDLPDLLILDLTMPELTGGEVFAQVRAEHPALPVVLYSGYSASSLGDLGDDPRAAYLHKPFSLHDLLDAVRRARGR